MRKILLFLGFLILSGCDLNHVELYTPPSKSQLAHAALRKSAANLKAKENLRPFGTGSQMMDQIKMLALSFNYYEPVDIEKGRELLIAAIDELTTIVNEDARIRPYLHNYPFTPKNVEISIFIRKPDGSSVDQGKLSIISADNGILSYEIDNPKGRFEFKIDVLKETYEEAHAKKQKSLAIKKVESEKIPM